MLGPNAQGEWRATVKLRLVNKRYALISGHGGRESTLAWPGDNFRLARDPPAIRQGVLTSLNGSSALNSEFRPVLSSGADIRAADLTFRRKSCFVSGS
jgi:hypothetical protein